MLVINFSRVKHDGLEILSDGCGLTHLVFWILISNML